jgi:putative tricarboxylic transport membrane protein
LWIVGGLVAQILLLSTVGFSIATGILFAFTAKGFGRGPLWKTIPAGALLAFIVWVIFAKGLQLSLPAGPLERLLP